MIFRALVEPSTVETSMVFTELSVEAVAVTGGVPPRLPMEKPLSEFISR